jgi:glyoxylase-like metal-dependent hydrolase (beta-lactamase superfamily II)
MKILTTGGGTKVINILSGRSNVFLILKSEFNILVDTSPGTYRRKLDTLLKKLNISRIDYLVLTHSHYDHAENAGFIKKTYGARVIINQEEAGFLERGENIVPKGTHPLPGALISIFSPLFVRLARYEPCAPDISAGSLYEFKEPGLNVHIIHTPGHTQGSMSVIVDNEIALVGDAMFGIFRDKIMPPFGNDKDQIVRSWGKLLETGCRIFLPSHGKPRLRDTVERNYKKECGKIAGK